MRWSCISSFSDKVSQSASLPAAAAIVVAQVSLNVGAALGKGLFPLVGPEGVAALRTGIAAIILLIATRPWRRRYTSKQIGWLLAYGLTLGGMNLLIYWAIQRIPIGLAVAIEISGPLAVVLVTARTRRDILWLTLAVFGLLLLIPWPGRSEALDGSGIACALGAASCWALYIVLGKRAANTDSGAAVAIGMTAACLITLPVGIATAGTNLVVWPVLGTGCIVAILSSALPYVLEMKALERLTSRLFGVVTSCAPAIAALVGFLILGEHLSPLQWLAIAAMIGASAGCSLTTRSIVSSERDDVMA